MVDYREILSEAEEAVSGVKNDKLREVAFAQLVSHLLSGKNNKADKNIREPVLPRHKGSAKLESKKPGGTRAWLRELKEDDFFSSPRNVKAILEELASHSHHLKGSDLTSALEYLCHEKLLRRKKMPPGDGRSPVWHWSNW
jgi:hypothetical protein